MPKTEELLAVLDLPEDEQIIWCAKNAGLDLLDGTLADLAFRLRDEANPLKFRWALKDVHEHILKETQSWLDWFVAEAKPIHWIIAALIAKALAEEESGS